MVERWKRSLISINIYLNDWLVVIVVGSQATFSQDGEEHSQCGEGGVLAEELKIELVQFVPDTRVQVNLL